ncbi:MAG TPA: fasciclin domain-containing protein [Caldilineaceae bacterium]|nr:fasciclin domain-containing protein [Caldilineaceae bacterium]
MVKRTFEKVTASLLVALLVMTSTATWAGAVVQAAPATQGVRDHEVKGMIPGGEFAKIWLGLEPEQSGAPITVIAEWDRPDAQNNGVGFFILDDNGLRQVGEEALSSIAIAAGDSNFILNGPSNQQGASINPVGLAKYTLVVYNDSASDANFTLRANGGFISDDSGKVTGASSAPATTETTEGAVEDPGAIPTTTTAPATPVAPAATVEASTETTATVATTTTTTAAAAATPATTTAPAVTTTPTEVRATTMQGDLPEQDDQHFLGLVPSQRDGNITLMLTFDPQDSSELARRLNFWVLDEAGLTQYLRGTSPGEVAIAAGNRTFRGDTNERVASFNAVGLGPYTVIVYNNSRVPGSYTLSVEGGTLIDGSGQTNTAKAAGATGVASTGAVTATGTTTGTTPAAATTTVAASTTTTTTTTTAARAGEPGGTYTVKSGDTIALIARDIYGDYRLYQQICAFNGITNCDVIEVGDVIRLPTQAQLQSGATAPAAPAAAAAATPAATPTRAAAVAATTAVTTTAGVTTTAPVTRTSPVTTTSAATTTARTGTTTTRTITSTTGSASATASGETLVAALEADGRFTSLVEALQATGLDSVLNGNGPFTVFAPTDAAFAALPAGAFDQLLSDPGGQLTDILRYHIIAGQTLAEDISNGMTATTVQGKPVRFEVQGNTIKINGANVITRDIMADNGVIHVIDAVILPPPE